VAPYAKRLTLWMQDPTHQALVEKLPMGLARAFAVLYFTRNVPKEYRWAVRTVVSILTEMNEREKMMMKINKEMMGL
jgi:hypothetical protein